MRNEETRPDGWGPFTSRQLMGIVCVAIVATVSIPTAAMAASGMFTSSTAAPAVTGSNSATVANATGVLGSATGSNTNARYGVKGSAGGANGVGVQGTGPKYGVFSDGPLGVAPGKSLVCNQCVTRNNLSNTAVKGVLLYQTSAVFSGPFHDLQDVATFTVPAGLMCLTGAASAYATERNKALTIFFAPRGGTTAPSVEAGGLTNEAYSHKTLVSGGTQCRAVAAGTYTYRGDSTLDTTTDSLDWGSLSVQVFSQ